MNYVSRLAAVALVVLLVGAAVPAGGRAPGLRLDVEKRRYVLDEDVTVSLENRRSRAVTIERAFIKHRRSGEIVVRLPLAESERRFPAGAMYNWAWSGTTRPGHYVAVVKTSAGGLRDRFEVGQYFTIGFRQHGDDVSFIVYVRERKPIRQMIAEAERPEDERNLITSGIVRPERPYNPAWSYTMGPGSIVLGEVFIEVCDASPEYVEENREEWMGTRWCPWSSFVKSVGR